MTGMPILMLVDVTPWSAGLEAPADFGTGKTVAPNTATMLAMVGIAIRTRLVRLFGLCGSVRAPPANRCMPDRFVHSTIAIPHVSCIHWTSNATTWARSWYRVVLDQRHHRADRGRPERVTMCEGVADPFVAPRARLERVSVFINRVRVEEVPFHLPT